MIKINICPVCGNKLLIEKTYNPVGLLKRSYINRTLLVSATCFHTNPDDPLHYYGNFSDAKYPSVVLFDEFSINIGNKYVMFSNVYSENRSLIWSREGSKSIGLPFIIEPDYPNLTSLKKKVRSSITFS